MALNRRTFIGLGSLLACGAAVAPSAAFGAPVKTLAGGLPLWSADAQVLAWVRSYSTSVRVIGVSVLGRLRSAPLRELHVLAEVSDLSVLAEALPSAPFPGVYSSENTLSFTTGQSDVIVENLLPEDFAARLAALRKRRNVAFAHDGLAYDPATQEVSDPYGAGTGGVRLVNPTFGGAAALAVALRGTLEAQQLGLPAAPNFNTWKTRVLRQIAHARDVSNLSQLFLQRLASLADLLPTAAFEDLLRSRLVSTALQQVFGISTEAILAAFAAKRAEVGSDVSDAAIWLSLLLGPEILSNAADGAATAWLQRGNRFEVMRSRRALAQAQTLV